uniref:Phosphoglucomutase-2 n=1 Tax=Strigamia maritima TaxID=126957 RepID=T1JNB8_STRMM
MSSKIQESSAELATKIEEWLQWDKNVVTHDEIQKLIDENQKEKLQEVLLHRLKFGTAGIRGAMAAGFNRMNDLVLIQTSQGLAKYLIATCPKVKNEGIVLGYDGRHNSYRFARLSAVAFLSCEIPTYLFSKMVPTPFIPFGVCHFKAACGVVVTASHNPKEDNGYKVYWSNGAQIIHPHDKGIQDSILRNLAPWPQSWDDGIVDRSPLCKDPLAEVMKHYYEIMANTMIDKECNNKCKTKFTYTPMHGVGNEYVKKAFEVCNFAPFIPVKEQMLADPEFPTVKFPNPEEGQSALDLAIKTADAANSTVVLANDPDADRLAIAEKQPGNQWKIYTGNEIGALLGWWLWFCWKQKNPLEDAGEVYMIASTVSSKILRAIAKVEGFNFIETLTGFKWMGNKGHELLGKGKTVLFAFEEAIGFMCGSNVLDKDGITAAMKIAEMTAHLEKQNLSLTQQLHKIYQRYGYHLCKNSYYLCCDPPTIAKMFYRLRNYNGTDTYPEECGPWIIENVRDLTTGYDSSQANKQATLPMCKSGQMITFTFANGCVATLRTSGTEPKVKYYTEFCAKPNQSDWSILEKELCEMVKGIIDEFMQPTQNKLVPRT